jgi:hypothetical protein
MTVERSNLSLFFGLCCVAQNVQLMDCCSDFFLVNIEIFGSTWGHFMENVNKRLKLSQKSQCWPKSRPLTGPFELLTENSA